MHRAIKEYRKTFYVPWGDEISRSSHKSCGHFDKKEKECSHINKCQLSCDSLGGDPWSREGFITRRQGAPPSQRVNQNSAVMLAAKSA